MGGPKGPVYTKVSWLAGWSLEKRSVENSLFNKNSAVSVQPSR
jgi:hypothetical protein